MKNHLEYLEGLIKAFREEKETLEKIGDIKNDAYYQSVKDQLFLVQCIRTNFQLARQTEREHQIKVLNQYYGKQRQEKEETTH